MNRDQAANLIIADYIARQKGYRTKEERITETVRIANQIDKICKEAEE